MKKVLMSLSAVVFVVSLVGCDYFGSPEQKAFEQFVAKCKKDPSTADCKAWEESKRSPGG